MTNWQYLASLNTSSFGAFCRQQGPADQVATALCPEYHATHRISEFGHAECVTILKLKFEENIFQNSITLASFDKAKIKIEVLSKLRY